MDCWTTQLARAARIASCDMYLGAWRANFFSERLRENTAAQSRVRVAQVAQSGLFLQGPCYQKNLDSCATEIRPSR
jgi:hypothetical protein